MKSARNCFAGKRKALKEIFRLDEIEKHHREKISFGDM